MVKNFNITPKTALFYITRDCPRNCSYCSTKNVDVGKYLSPGEWVRVFDILSSEGINFFINVGLESLTYPNFIELIRLLNESGFRGSYAMYTTFPEPWYRKLKEKLLEVGIWNISTGVDILIPSRIDRHVDKKHLGIETIDMV